MSWNSLSLEGIKPISSSLDSIGVLARSIEDLQLVAHAFTLEGRQQGRQMSLKNAKVALIKSPMWRDAGPGTVAAIEKAAKTLASHSVQVEEVAFPSDMSDSMALKVMHKKVFCAEAKITFLREYRTDKRKISQEIRNLVENKPGYTLDETLIAVDQYAVMRPLFDKVASNYSAIITPSATDEAPLGIGDMGDSAFNFLWTVSSS